MHNLSLRGYSSLAGVLEDAAARLQAAGFTGAQCRTEEVGYPGGSYRQNICSVPGVSEGMDANLTLAMTPQQLQATYNMYRPQQGERSYFEAMQASIPNVRVVQEQQGMTSLAPGTGSGYRGDFASYNYQASSYQPDTRSTPGNATAPTTPVPASPTTQGSAGGQRITYPNGDVALSERNPASNQIKDMPEWLGRMFAGFANVKPASNTAAGTGTDFSSLFANPLVLIALAGGAFLLLRK